MFVDRFRIAVAVLVLAGTLFAVSTAQSIPRYSARYEQSCNLCHVSPSGGGQRSTYATQFIVPQEMAMTQLSEEELAAITPNISDAITLGADLRTVFFKSNLESSENIQLRRLQSENFFQMQGNVYVSLQMTSKISAHFSKGITQSYELYGLGYVLPADGYLKVGRFVPSFGWRFADHNFFVRDYVGFFPPSHTDVGLEAGISPGRLSLSAAVLNGQLGSTRDFNDKVAMSARALYRWNVSGFGAALGGSFWRNENASNETFTAGGVFGYFRLASLTWLWEADAGETRADSDTTKTWFTSNELSWQVMQGMDIKGTFDLFDPNSDADTGKRFRYGLGTEVIPYPFVKLELVYNWHRNSSGMDITEPEYNQVIVQAHFFY